RPSIIPVVLGASCYCVNNPLNGSTWVRNADYDYIGTHSTLSTSPLLFLQPECDSVADPMLFRHAHRPDVVGYSASSTTARTITRLRLLLVPAPRGCWKRLVERHRAQRHRQGQSGGQHSITLRGDRRESR